MSTNANNFKDRQWSGREQEEKRLPIPPLSFHIIFDVLLTGVKGHNSSESHFTVLNMLQKVM